MTDKPDAGEAMPCPFCGEARRLSVGPGSAQQTTFVMCMGCGASGPNSWGHEDNVPYAIAAWNRRPSSRRIEELEKALTRIGISEVMTIPFAIPDTQCGDELKARIEYARAALSPPPAVADTAVSTDGEDGGTT